MLIRILTSSAAIACILGSTTTAIAQIAADESLGVERSVLTPNVQSTKGNINRIDGGAIREHPNLAKSPQAISLGLQKQSLPPQAISIVKPASAGLVRVAIPFQGIAAKLGCSQRFEVVTYSTVLVTT